LLQLDEMWGKKYAIAVKSWENNWEDLATFFAYSAEISRLIYTTNAIEGYNRGLRRVVKTKASFPTAEAARKLLYLANQNMTKKWTMPLQHWADILNQLAIQFVGRFSL
jgi:putative transposase